MGKSECEGGELGLSALRLGSPALSLFETVFARRPSLSATPVKGMAFSDPRAVQEGIYGITPKYCAQLCEDADMPLCGPVLPHIAYTWCHI